MDIDNSISLSEICYCKGKFQQCLDICESLIKAKLTFENLIDIECIISNFSTLKVNGKPNPVSLHTVENVIKLISQNSYAKYHSPYIKASLIQFIINNGFKDKNCLIEIFMKIAEETNDVFAMLHLAEISSIYCNKTKKQLIKVANTKVKIGYDYLVFLCSNLYKEKNNIEKQFLVPAEVEFINERFLPPEKHNILYGTLAISSLILKDLIILIPKHYLNIDKALHKAVTNIVLADTGYSCYFSLLEESCIRWKDNTCYLQKIFDSAYKKFKNASYCLPELTKIADKYL